MQITINQEWRTVSPGATGMTVVCSTGQRYDTVKATR